MTAIEIHRRAKGWTQEQLGQRVGTSARVVCIWESGRIPSRKFLQKVADVLEITPLQIIESAAAKAATSAA